MLSFISFLLVCVGCINWFCIGILQFDFVAGIFGSQSNIFSRLIYTLVGVASIVVIVNFITNKGKFVVSFKKADEEFEEMKEEGAARNRRRALATESSEEFSLSKALREENEKNTNTESAEDFHKTTNTTKKSSCECEGKRNCECGKDYKSTNNKDDKQV